MTGCLMEMRSKRQRVSLDELLYASEGLPEF